MPADGYTLVIGDKNFSSWSLRPWIAMKYVRLPFAEERIRLRWPGSSGAILRHSSSGEVPAIKTNGLVVFDSLAILEFLAERHPELQFWPRDVEARARGALDLGRDAFWLRHAPQRHVHGCARAPAHPADRGRARRATFAASWRSGVRRGRDMARPSPSCSAPSPMPIAMFTPVATRFRTYGVDLRAFGDDGQAAAYADTILALPEMAE